MVQVPGRGVVYVAERHAALCKYVIPLSLAIEKVPSWRRERGQIIKHYYSSKRAAHHIAVISGRDKLLSLTELT